MQLLIRFAVAILALAVWLSAHAKSEHEWTAEWCGAKDLTYDAAGDGMRPDALELATVSGRTVLADCIGEVVVVEVDFADKYHQGIGQAIDYATLSRKRPVLLLIVETRADCAYVIDALAALLRARIPIMVFTTGYDCTAPTRTL